jgi:hypothetical protein
MVSVSHAAVSEAPVTAEAAAPSPRRPRLGFLTHLHVGADAADSYRIALELFEAAEALGFDSGWVAQHHFLNGSGRLPSTLTFLAAAAQRTRRIQLGTAIVILPLEDPLRVAEDAAVVDTLSGGRLQLGLGSGDATRRFDRRHRCRRALRPAQHRVRYSDRSDRDAGQRPGARPRYRSADPGPTWIPDLRPECVGPRNHRYRGRTSAGLAPRHVRIRTLLMSRTTLFNWRRSSLAFVAVAALVLTACSTAAPVAPTSSTPELSRVTLTVGSPCKTCLGRLLIASGPRPGRAELERRRHRQPQYH